MFALEHRVRVFVFQVLEAETQFLLLRHKPRAEWPLGPVVGAVRVGDHMKDTVVRQVKEETGIYKPLHILDLSTPQKELFGDVGLVEWSFAYQAGTPSNPIQRVTPSERVDEIAWLSFEEAFQRLEMPRDREDLVRLRWRLESN
jgi:8-oxo-dGTP pyrophosphatase MutT (NUDIX family)